MEEFSERERQLLEPFVSNLDKPIFALTNLPEVVKGALFSRYSRSAKSLRRVLLDEFMLAPETGMAEILGALPKNQAGPVQTRKAEEFYERVLVGYGDDSVAELAGCHVAVEDISILATKTLQDSRLGLSPLEKSTRYVYFDNKREDGTWRYHREKTLMDSEFAELYVKTCDRCFQTYAELIPKISAYVTERTPKDADTSDRAYKSTIRAKTCDILRGLLPASTITNMGFFGDGRAYEYLLTKLYSDDLAEMRGIAALMQGELAKVIPSFVKRANDKYGTSMQEYFRRVRKDVGAEARRHDSVAKGPLVELVEYEEDAERKAAAFALYPQMNCPLSEVLEKVGRMGKQERDAVIRAYVNQRENRRHKPGRAFEHISYTFDICANYGAYRDLHRHRVLTQERQYLSPHLGFKMPREIVEAGYGKEFTDVMEGAKNAYEAIAEKYPREAQYVIPLAYNIRWYMTMNLREAYHMLELRSGMQGHADYREVAQQMFREIERVHPALASGMKFMDMKEYALERLEAEKRIDRKLEEISEKYGR
ncbi:MAG TPA: FAD-dependent thymidylate synthase [Candidatus Bilamarchaeum sp.]|nr:FAD-dependent thymidylate synthase [Candidatus Bilamarchaeum sp.]